MDDCKTIVSEGWPIFKGRLLSSLATSQRVRCPNLHEDVEGADGFSKEVGSQFESGMI